VQPEQLVWQVEVCADAPAGQNFLPSAAQDESDGGSTTKVHNDSSIEVEQPLPGMAFPDWPHVQVTVASELKSMLLQVVTSAAVAEVVPSTRQVWP